MRIIDIISEAPLSPGLFKYKDDPRDRVIKFIKRLVAGEAFTVLDASGKQTQVHLDPTEAGRVSDLFRQGIKPKTIRTTDGKDILFTSIVKDNGFGGGKDNESYEKSQVADINEQIQKACQAAGTSDIKIQIGKGGRKVPASAAIKAPGGIKADAIIVDSQNNHQAWISLKSAPGPRAIAGWGGITHPPVRQHPEVVKFINDAKIAFGNQIPNKSSFGRRIEDQTLKNQIVFGKEFGKPARGPSNVDAVMAGHPTLRNNVLVGSDMTWLNGVTPSGEYDPVFNISYKGDRSNEGISGARISVQADKGRSWKPLDDLLQQKQSELPNQQTSQKPVSSVTKNTKKVTSHKNTKQNLGTQTYKDTDNAVHDAEHEDNLVKRNKKISATNTSVR